MQRNKKGKTKENHMKTLVTLLTNISMPFSFAVVSNNCFYSRLAGVYTCTQIALQANCQEYKKHFLMVHSILGRWIKIPNSNSFWKLSIFLAQTSFNNITLTLTYTQFNSCRTHSKYQLKFTRQNKICYCGWGLTLYRKLPQL